MRLLLFITVILLTTHLKAQDLNYNPSKKYHPDSLKKWAVNAMNGISGKHPGFYRYTTKERFDFLIDSTVQTIHDSLTELDYYRKLKPLFSQIGCLHTGISLSKECTDYLDNTSTLVPLEVFIDADSRVFITKNYSSNTALPIRGEIIAINAKPISAIVNELLKAVPMDGFNKTGKLLLLNHRFAFWYQTMMEATEQFTVAVASAGTTETYVLNGVSKNVFPSIRSLTSGYKEPLELQIQDKTAILAVHTFSKSEIKSHHQNFKKYIAKTFKTLRDQKVENLIVDLRYNSGGTDGNAACLASYFFDKPFRYWDRIEVTEAIAKEISGWKRLFYKKPLHKNESYRWRKMWLTHEFDYYETQKPASNNFEGKVFLLTNGLCMSSCSDFIAILSYNNKAKVIGQESGGGYQGNTSGMIPTAKIGTGLRITIPLQKYTNAVDPNKNRGRGTIPDYQTTPTVDDWINKKDLEMELAWRKLRE